MVSRSDKRHGGYKILYLIPSAQIRRQPHPLDVIDAVPSQLEFHHRAESASCTKAPTCISGDTGYKTPRSIPTPPALPCTLSGRRVRIVPVSRELKLKILPRQSPLCRNARAASRIFPRMRNISFFHQTANRRKRSRPSPAALYWFIG